MIFSVLNSFPNLIIGKFLMILWSLWRQRNYGIMNIETMHSALEVHGDWLKAQALKAHLRASIVSGSSMLWHKPPSNFLKCNTNTTTFTNTSYIGLVAVPHDANGTFVAAWTSTLVGIPFVKGCEALALSEAMSWATDLGYKRVIFESDAKQVVTTIKSLEDDNSEFGDIISRCHIGFSFLFLPRLLFWYAEFFDSLFM